MLHLTINRIPEEEISTWETEWNSLLEKSITNEIFLSWEWIYSWWDVFKDKNKKLFILVGKNSNNEVIGIAPFYVEDEEIFGLFHRKVMRICSSKETCPDHLDLISREEYADEFTKAVFRYISENNTEWDIIKLEGIKENSKLKEFISEQSFDSFIIDCIPESGCPYLRINQRYEEYIKSFSSKKRYNLLKKRRILLERENVQFKMAQGTEDPEKFIKDLFSLHGERAKRQGIKTSFNGNGIYIFHRNFISLLKKEGKIILAFLYRDDIPLASYYCLKHGGKYYYYQSGISVEGEKKGAGVVLLSMLIERAFDEGCSEFDFLRGEEEYKYFWTKESRWNYTAVLRKISVADKLSHVGLRTYRKIKNVRKYF